MKESCLLYDKQNCKWAKSTKDITVEKIFKRVCLPIPTNLEDNICLTFFS